MTSSNVPCALGMAAETHASGRDFLTACVIGLEAAARVGLGGKGGFQKAGFHPTSICGTMSSSLVAGRLMGLDQEALSRAQGIGLSMASGTMQPVQDGTWTKRMHPGWAAAAGISAAALAEGGFTGPDAAYEGRFGFYQIFLGSLAVNADPSLVTQGLGESWEFVRSSIKLYPACHQSHAFVNAAIKIATDNELRIDDIESVNTLVAEMTRDLVCEPAEAKSHPDSSYLAQFSLPYAMAASLTRKQFGLAEIEESAYTDPRLVALAQKVRYELDPNAGFPKTRTGEVIVKLRNGKELRERNEIRPDEPASEDAIVAKFMANAARAMSTSRATELCELILSIEREPDTSRVCRALA
jgi:2-methylcitrate dehydratase PrpD